MYQNYQNDETLTRCDIHQHVVDLKPYDLYELTLRGLRRVLAMSSPTPDVAALRVFVACNSYFVQSAEISP